MASYGHIVAGALAASVAPLVPGPTKDEWASVLVGFAALLVRELVFWLRKRSE